MCGIVGIFYLDGERRVRPEDLARMNATIVHRGPDDEGYFLDGPVGFGVRRLSIVDRAGGHQPLSGEDARVWIAFNGEIYNHPELRHRLMGQGHTYRTNCDTETVVHAYEQAGERMVESLRGMFAFALWDRSARRLLLYRDRLGIKPLYYGVYDDALVFASEVKALLAYGVPFGVDEDVFECYLRLGYVPGERTMFRSVVKLAPGHYLTAEAGGPGPRIRPYWQPDFAIDNTLDEPRSLREFGALLEETVALHQLGEVPQGILLSGGVDSTSLLAIHAGQLRDPALTFSVGYPDDRASSELPMARAMAARYGARHFEYELSAPVFAASLPRLVWHMDEPVAEMAATPLYHIAQLARQHITVVHSGEGADEILAGYGAYRRMEQISAWQRRMGSLTPALTQALTLPMVPYRYRRYASLLAQPLWQRYQGVRSGMPEFLLAGLAREGFPTAGQRAYREAFYAAKYGALGGAPELNQMLGVDLQGWLPDDLLVKADKMTMAASIELRVPFLDHVVVEFTNRLPLHLKRRAGRTKYLLKEWIKDRVPPSILDAPKRGFPIPLARWFRGELRGAVRGWLLDSKFLAGFFLPDRLESLLDAHAGGGGDYSTEIYGLVCASLWYDTFARPGPQ